MRIKRSVVRFFGLMVLPAVTIAVVGYFGAYAIWGERGVLALEETKARLDTAKVELAQVTENRARLQHRIALMEQGTPDADMVEELSRIRLMNGAPNQYAIPRDAK